MNIVRKQPQASIPAVSDWDPFRAMREMMRWDPFLIVIHGGRNGHPI